MAKLKPGLLGKRLRKWTKKKRVSLESKWTNAFTIITRNLTSWCVFFSAKLLPVKQIFRSIDVELYTVADWYFTEKAICDWKYNGNIMELVLNWRQIFYNGSFSDFFNGITVSISISFLIIILLQLNPRRARLSCLPVNLSTKYHIWPSSCQCSCATNICGVRNSQHHSLTQSAVVQTCFLQIKPKNYTQKYAIIGRLAIISIDTMQDTLTLYSTSSYFLSQIWLRHIMNEHLAIFEHKRDSLMVCLVRNWKTQRFNSEKRLNLTSTSASSSSTSCSKVTVSEDILKISKKLSRSIVGQKAFFCELCWLIKSCMKPGTKYLFGR